MWRYKKISICRNCGKEYHALSSSWGIFCCLKCQHGFKFKINIEEWLSGKVNPINTNGLLRPWGRRYLFIINKNRCSQCGWGEINKTTGKVPLEVDHIDGNYRNNKLDNLRLLCPNCHSLTSNFKNLNKGNGRVGRK
jgi:ribosomal protein L37E